MVLATTTTSSPASRAEDDGAWAFLLNLTYAAMQNVNCFVMSVVRSVGLYSCSSSCWGVGGWVGLELKCTTTDTSEQVYRHEGRQQTVNYLGKCSCFALAVDVVVVLVYFNLIPRPEWLTDLLHVLLCHVPVSSLLGIDSNLIRYNNMLVDNCFVDRVHFHN